MRASGNQSVMASRADPLDSLDYFPTPPWATRALLEHVVGLDVGDMVAWEPAAGSGHMSDVLGERFMVVYASDVHDYGRGYSDGSGYAVGSFVGEGPDVVRVPCEHVDWIITNPPFKLAMEFAERALDVARVGVALLVRSVWSEGRERYERLFSKRPPSIVAAFSERVPMVKGRWDPQATTATAYSWYVWRKHHPVLPGRPVTLFEWIPPGCRAHLTYGGDVKKFAGR